MAAQTTQIDARITPDYVTNISIVDPDVTHSLDPLLEHCVSQYLVLVLPECSPAQCLNPRCRPSQSDLEAGQNQSVALIKQLHATSNRWSPPPLPSASRLRGGYSNSEDNQLTPMILFISGVQIVLALILKSSPPLVNPKVSQCLEADSQPGNPVRLAWLLDSRRSAGAQGGAETCRLHARVEVPRAGPRIGRVAILYIEAWQIHAVCCSRKDGLTRSWTWRFS